MDIAYVGTYRARLAGHLWKHGVELSNGNGVYAGNQRDLAKTSERHRSTVVLALKELRREGVIGRLKDWPGCYEIYKDKIEQIKIIKSRKPQESQ